MKVQIAKNPFSAFLMRAGWYCSLLALSLAITANICQIWLLGQEPTLLGSVPFSLGQCVLLAELKRPQQQYRRPRLAVASCLMIGGGALFLIQILIPLS